MTAFDATVAPMLIAEVAMKPESPVPTPGSATASPICTAMLTAERIWSASRSLSSS